jgi:hypothetical protein
MATKHPARFLSEDERLDYVTAVASLLSSREHEGHVERDRLADLCEAIEIDERERAKVLESAERPDAKRVERAVASMAGRPAISLALLTDAIAIAFADEHLASSEADAIARMAERLRVSLEDAMLIAKYVESLTLHHGDPSLDHMASELRQALEARDPAVLRRLAGVKG